MPESEPTEITGLLLAWRDGDQEALQRLIPLVYDELHELAGRHLRGERPDHTLQTTGLIHEAYLRLVGSDVAWEGRIHFLRVAATTMRRILVDHARAKRRHKRGGGVEHVSFDDDLVVGDMGHPDLVALDEALTRFSTLDERKARAIELHFFGGLTHAETAEALGVSPATVDRELRLAKAWLYKELTDAAGPQS